MFEEKVKVNLRGDALRIKVLYEFMENYAFMQDNLTDFIRWGAANGLYVSVLVLQRKYNLDRDSASLLKEALLESGVAVLLEDRYVGEFAITKEQAAELADELDSYENPHVIHLATLANPHEPSMDERSWKIIKRIVKEKAPMLLSTYLCERSGDNVFIPIPEITAWAITECEGKKSVVLAHHILMFDILFSGYVIECGHCEFKKGKIWRMPKPVADLLNSERLVCRGVGEYAELFTEEEYEIIKKRESVALEFLKNLDSQ